MPVIDEGSGCSYGDMPSEMENQDDFSTAVTGLLLEHPIINRSTWGSAVGAKLAQVLCGEPVHPKSEMAVFVAAIIAGAAEAVITRIRLASGKKGEAAEKLEDEIRELLWGRLRVRECESCTTKIPIRHWWCRKCAEDIDRRAREWPE